MILVPQSTLLFIGDSITHAHRRPDELHDCYNLGCGYVNHLAAQLNTDHPALQLRFLNRGQCGDTIQHLQTRWPHDCLAHQPDLISILIGINDADPAQEATQSPEDFARIYHVLLQSTHTHLSNPKLVLLEPFLLRNIHESTQRFDNLKPLQQIIRTLAEQFSATFIPLQSVFDKAVQKAPPAHWALDGIHPSAAGHQLIARAWLKAIQI